MAKDETDAPEEDKDVVLQRSSAESLRDVKDSLEGFLWTTTKSGGRKIRRRVRVKDTDRLVNLVCAYSIPWCSY